MGVLLLLGEQQSIDEVWVIFEGRGWLRNPLRFVKQRNSTVSEPSWCGIRIRLPSPLEDHFLDSGLVDLLEVLSAEEGPSKHRDCVSLCVLLAPEKVVVHIVLGHYEGPSIKCGSPPSHLRGFDFGKVGSEFGGNDTDQFLSHIQKVGLRVDGFVPVEEEGHFIALAVSQLGTHDVGADFDRRNSRHPKDDLQM